MVASYNKAVAFFNRHTIPHRCRDEEEEEKRTVRGAAFKAMYRHARRSDENSEPYPAFSVDTDELGPFGVGIALYFKQLQWLCIAFLFYGVISLYNMIYFASESYDPTATITSDYYTLLPGSAYCNSYTTVEATSGCPNGDATCDSSYAEYCELQSALGIVNMVGIFFLFLYILLIGWIQNREQKELDEAVQTCSDYAVTVMDPEPEDDDPAEWEQYFSQFGKVAYITIARANSELVTALATRRSIKANIALVSKMNLESDSGSDSAEKDTEEAEKTKPTEVTLLLNDGSDQEETDARSTFWRLLWKMGLVKDADDLKKDLKEINKKIKEYRKKNYPVTRVYCVFTTERARKECLNNLCTGTLAAAFDWKGQKKESLMFKGTNLLNVQPSCEPSEVLWENLELGFRYMTLQRIVSLLSAVVVVYLAYLAIKAMKNYSSSEVLSLGVSVINSLLPYICYYMTVFERHKNQSHIQDSLMIKLLIARYMNTALISYFTTDATDTLSYDSMATIQALMVSDAFFTPLISALDIYNNICRYFVSRISYTQRQMNTYFLGSAWDLGERYTSMLKTVFVAVFYAAVYPAGLFFASFCFGITYIVDRFMLTRLWKKAPLYDATLAEKAVKTLFLTLLAHLVVSFVWYAEWPFDTTYFDGTTYEYVDKSALYENFVDLFSSSTTYWMSTAQLELVTLYRIAALILLIIVSIYVAYLLFNFGKTLLFGEVGPAEEDQHIPFNKVQNIPVFVPMCSSPSALVGDLVAAHTINLRRNHYPEFSAGDIFDDLDKAFHNNNLALEFPKRKRGKLFGIIQGFHNYFEC